MEQEENISSKELRLVVLGAIQAGKTSLITSLLGKTDTQTSPVRTVNCIRHEGQLSGRKLTVVDTPGWWNGYDLIDTAQRTKHELLLSVRQCPPGPHVFILAIEVASFKDRNLRTVKEHLGLFGEHIWGHTVLVFTKGESLKGRSIEQHIENEGEALQWLVEKCGNRYCVLDKLSTGQDQFLGVIESLVDSNCGGHFQLDDRTLKEVEEKKRAAQERARVRQDEVQGKRKHLQEQGVLHRLKEVRIVMLGWVVSGKSAARNVILNKEKYAALSKTERCERETTSVDGRPVTVVDTPGWWKYFSAQFTPEQVKSELKQSVSFGSKSPHALLLVVPADVSFLKYQRKITEDNMKMFGDHVWRHTIVLFTWGDSLGNTSIEEHIESEGEHLQWLVEKCGNRYHVFDNVNRADGSQVQDLVEKVDELEASLDLCNRTQEAPIIEITPSYKKEDWTTSNMVLLDKKRSRRHKTKRVKGLEQEAGTGSKSCKSLGAMPDFHEHEPTDKDTVKSLPVDLHRTKDFDPKHTLIPSVHEHEPTDKDTVKSLPVDLHRTKDFDPKHTLIPSEDGQHHGLPHRHQSSLNETDIEMLQREWLRYKVINMDRVWRFLIPDKSSEAERRHDSQKHGGRELEEWAVVMEKVKTIISKLYPHSDASEPGEEEHQQSIQKVLMWLTTTHSSDLGFESDPEDSASSCAE